MSEEIVPVHVVRYENDENVEIEEDENGYPLIANHDELAKLNVVIGMERGTAEEHGYGENILTPSHPLWCDEYADIDYCEEIVI